MLSNFFGLLYGSLSFLKFSIKLALLKFIPSFRFLYKMYVILTLPTFLPLFLLPLLPLFIKHFCHPFSVESRMFGSSSNGTKTVLIFGSPFVANSKKLEFLRSLFSPAKLVPKYIRYSVPGSRPNSKRVVTFFLI